MGRKAHEMQVVKENVALQVARRFCSTSLTL